MEKEFSTKITKLFLTVLTLFLLISIVSAYECNDGIDNDNDGQIDALVNTNIGGGDFLTRSAGSKYSNTWLSTITCRDHLGNTNTFGEGTRGIGIAGLLSVRMSLLNLPYNDPTLNGYYILRSDSNGIHMPTVNAVCKILGYEEYVSSTCSDGEKCYYHSPYDNTIIYFSGTIKIPECADGIDNDNDGKIDTADSGCESSSDNSELQHDTDCTGPTDDSESPRLKECNDNIDNDNDGLIDSADPGCWTDTTNPSTYNPDLDDESRKNPECLINSDCADDYYSNNYCYNNDVYHNLITSSCSQAYTCESNSQKLKVSDCENGCYSGECISYTECEDNLDNDNDGLIDSADPGCWNNPEDSSSYNPNLDDESAYDIRCYANTDCGTSSILGSICEGSDIFNVILTPTCLKPSTGLSSCTTRSILDFISSCSFGCANGECYGSCNTQSDCGGDSYSDNFCGEDNNVYKIFHDVSCESDLTCSEVTSDVLVETCDYACFEGECLGSCLVDSDCGENYYTDNYCSGDDVYRDYYTFSCESDYTCSEGLKTSSNLVESCAYGCSHGSCDSFCDTDGPIVNLVSPTDAETLYNLLVNFKYTASDLSGVKNCSLIVDSENLETDTSISSGQNLFTNTFTQYKSYVFSVGCFDTENNYGESEERTFTLYDLICSNDNDCGSENTVYFCEDDDLMRETTTPTCLDNLCSSDSEIEKVRTCIDGCSNGVCLSDSHDDDDDDGDDYDYDDDEDCEDCNDDPIIVRQSPIFKTNYTTDLPQVLVLSKSKPVVLNETKEGINWWVVAMIIIILAIIVILILIILVGFA